MKTINIYAEEVHVFPYECICPNEEIIIWGAGRICHEYLSQLNQNHYCHVKYIVDLNAPNIRFVGDIPVYSPNHLLDDASKVVIAIQNEISYREIEEYLKNNGYRDDLIIWRINSIPIIHEKSNMRSIAQKEYYTQTEFVEIHGCDYLDKLSKIRLSLNVYSPDCELVRVGSDNDGGYVMANRFFDGGIAYSFGIGNDVSWDMSMASKGYEIYMYDHTIEGLPHDNSRFHFNKMGISNKREPDDCLDTLENYIKRNKHGDRTNMILKMDVEGAEYGFMDAVEEATLKQFDQIMFELHSLNKKENVKNVLEFFSKISATHQLVNVHVNNYSDVFFVDEAVYPDTIEVTYLNKLNYRFVEGTIMGNDKLNSPNWIKIPEVIL